MKLYKKGKKKLTNPAPIPFIDKLSLIVTIPEVWSDKFNCCSDDFHAGYLLYTQDETVFGQISKPISNFRKAKTIKLESVVNSKHHPRMDYDFQGKEAKRLRIEFVPVDLGEDGLMELHSILQMLLPDGWGTFIKFGKVTRIDITVDFPVQHMPGWLFLPETLVTSSVWKSNGKLQTLVLGKSKGNSTTIYDRGAKRTSQGTNKSGKTGIRIERRLKNPNIGLQNLHELKNAFSVLDICRAITVSPSDEAKPYIWELFLRAVDKDGLGVVLGLLPPDKRKVYREHYKQYIAEWWNVEEIWKNWPNYLDETQIGYLKKWC